MNVSKSGLKLVCKVNILYGNLKSENSQDYDQKPRRIVHEFGFGTGTGILREVVYAEKMPFQLKSRSFGR